MSKQETLVTPSNGKTTNRQGRHRQRWGLKEAEAGKWNIAEANQSWQVKRKFAKSVEEAISEADEPDTPPHTSRAAQRMEELEEVAQTAETFGLPAAI